MKNPNTMFGKMKLAAITLELLGIAAIGAGIGVELVAAADIGLVVITIGSCLVAAGGIIYGKFLKVGQRDEKPSRR